MGGACPFGFRFCREFLSPTFAFRGSGSGVAPAEGIYGVLITHLLPLGFGRA